MLTKKRTGQSAQAPLKGDVLRAFDKHNEDLSKVAAEAAASSNGGGGGLYGVASLLSWVREVRYLGILCLLQVGLQRGLVGKRAWQQAPRVRKRRVRKRAWPRKSSRILLKRRRSGAIRLQIKLKNCSM